ncbi:TetR/AcrR family transcriptional regulator [Pseudonocardia sp. KRD291]|uniref:TetR/AcrR family transcriptional regulator n=1 Tax=Pseudonocardia sp. KRD291 TaxID=2792007 RepID=UPI001C49DEFD|nr:TetR/AcrR family transcriptional regulator [Pseudonocardia sp. KRD291]MBW0105048.1 TetR/AcrR family transcriptional regulator [Pseudonocardia sp. KRD291]
MARWEPDASRRLIDVALELFADRGYDNTTVVDIAQRAGLAKSTFFRHFQDKREVLFGEDALIEPLVDAIAAAPSAAAPLEAMACGFDALGRDVFTPDHRAFTVRRRAVIDAHPDLQEREALKGMSLTAAVVDALARRGVPRLVAGVTAQLGALALQVAVERWGEAEGADDFGDLTRQALGEVHAAASTM